MVGNSRAIGVKIPAWYALLGQWSSSGRKSLGTVRPEGGSNQGPAKYFTKEACQ